MQGMTKSISELFAMLKTAAGKSMKGPKGKKPQRDGKHVFGPPKGPKMKPGVKCFYCKGDGHWKCNRPKYLEDKKAGKVVARDKGIFDIHVIDIYLTSSYSNTWVFDTDSVANISGSEE
jgi:hypothetical protein